MAMVECCQLSLCQLGYLIVTLFIFHTSEFGLALLIHGHRHVSTNSFLFSKDYFLAMTCGVVEHLLESYFFPGMKEHVWISNAGLAFVVLGEIVRKLAILTAWNGFTHDIKTRHEDGHKLVTTGIYRLVRHPSYLGFMLWSTGTQIMLCNPICTFAYVFVLWRFFRARIAFEEYYLLEFFGSQYEVYAQRVPSGIPFVS